VITRATLRTVILTRGVQLASIQGLEGLTLGMIAADLNISKGGICAHFKTKTDLQLAVVESASQLFNERVVLPVRAKALGLPRLKALSASWFGYLEENVFQGGCFFTNALLELDDLSNTAVKEAVLEQYERYRAFIERDANHARLSAQFKETTTSTQFAFEFVGVQLAALSWRALGRADALISARLAHEALFERTKA
jgi:AcrR family transcriptional regulator